LALSASLGRLGLVLVTGFRSSGEYRIVDATPGQLAYDDFRYRRAPHRDGAEDSTVTPTATKALESVGALPESHKGLCGVGSHTPECQFLAYHFDGVLDTCAELGAGFQIIYRGFQQGVGTWSSDYVTLDQLLDETHEDRGLRGPNSRQWLR
jgi:hypothetical protein